MLNAQGRNGSDATRRHAGDMLRAFAARIGNRYLAEYPFEAARYLVYVTNGTNNQDIEVATSAIGNLIYQHRVEIKFITTTTLFNTDASRQMGAQTDRFHWPLDLLSLPSLPRDIRAALFHCAQLSVHPANIESSATVGPSLEALSVGTPSIYADNLSVADFVSKQPNFASYVYDPDDPAQLAQLIADMLLHRGDAIACQAPIAEMIRKYSWGCAAEQCARAVIGKNSVYNHPPTSLAC
jgi:glycosyltransferase involved in cell wall biosynthesis